MKKMKITFELVDEQEVKIINDGKIIGRIFTPSGTTKDMPNAIQICGFDDIFDYWGCGVFRDKNKKPKKDIQILFSEDSEQGSGKFEWLEDCGRCFYPKDKCMCWDLKPIRQKDIPKAQKKRDVFITKHKILDKL